MLQDARIVTTGNKNSVIDKDKISRQKKKTWKEDTE